MIAPRVTRNLGGPSRETTAPLLTTELPVADRPEPPVVQPTCAVQPPGVTPFHVPLLGQLPQIPRFTGEGHGSGESFSEWHEHFENIAKLVGWDDHWKLVHLTSNLRDTASSFHHSCSVDVQSNYQALVAALKRRFTPIRLTAIQAQLFHNRQQGENETVDQFAQELRKLYNLAYAGAACEGPQAERMGETLLTNQFVAGLHPELKRKLVGVDGGLILKARFEEAKGRELPIAAQKPPVRSLPTSKAPRSNGGGTSPSPPTTPVKTATTNSSGTKNTRGKCFNCGLEGHLARACPYPKRNKRDEEVHGPRRSTVSALAGEGDDTEKEIEELEQTLKAARAKRTIHHQSQVMNTLAADGESGDGKLGPTVFTEIQGNGIPTRALIDTGSPATVTSMDFVVDIFTKERRSQQTPQQWEEETMKKLSPPAVSLKAYSGHRLDILCQVCLKLSHSDRGATVLVQEGAPNKQLLGTDVQPKLGFALVAETAGKLVDLLTGEECPREELPNEDSSPCIASMGRSALCSPITKHSRHF